MMHMTFYWGRQVTLLVDSWRTTTWLEYALTLLVCVLASAFYQYLEKLRIRLKVVTSAAKSSAASPIQEPLLFSNLPSGKKWLLARLAGAVLFGFNAAIGYLLMLSVMSFNGGVFLAVVFGLAIGYLLLRSEAEGLMLVDNPCACA